MKALMEKSYDKPLDMEIVENLNVEETLGTVGPKQVKIAVKCAALNPVDGVRIHMKCDTAFPIVVGYDVAGVVQEVGSDVKESGIIKVGDRVFGDVQRISSGPKTCGAVAEYCIADADLLAVLPDNFSFAEGAAMPVVGLTSLQAMGGGSLPNDGVQLKEGEKAFITGGAGGVGIHAVQMAKNYFGASQVATTASEAKMEHIRKSTGTDTVDIMVNYKTEKADEKYANWAEFCLDTTKECDMLKTIVKDKTQVCSIAEFGDASIRSIQCQPNQADIQLLANMMKEGKVKPVIDTIFPFADALKAMEYQMSGRAKGKVIIQVAE